MTHNTMGLKQLRCALLIGALAVCTPLIADQELSFDTSTSEETLYGQLVWDMNKVQEHKKALPTFLRNRKIKHYALTAAVVGGVAGYIWYANQDPAPQAQNGTGTTSVSEPANPTPKTNTAELKKWPHNGGDMDFTKENFQKACLALQKLMPERNTDWFLWTDLGGVSFPYSPRLEPLAQATKAVATWSIGSFAFNKMTSVFSFREDMPWFYNEEKSIAACGKNLEALALDYDAAVATKMPISVIALKKQALLDGAHHYVDCLMALQVFMEHRSEQVLAKFDPEIRARLEQKFTMQANSVMQSGMEFCQKLNTVVAKTGQTPLLATENARAAVMQTHNLMHALVTSFMRLEDVYTSRKTF